MAVDTTSSIRSTRKSARPAVRLLASEHGKPRRAQRIAIVLLLNLIIFSTAFLLAEVGFRCFASPRYWIHTNQWMVGSGQTRAGKKLWPNTRYLIDSSEFHAVFETNHAGYRARPGAPPAPNAYRVAFVGDSFTEGMQVDAESTFCMRIERILNDGSIQRRERPYACENYGVAATDLLEYWHRIIHDVLQPDPPQAIVLCIYPGNDFYSVLPDDAFDEKDRPLRDYFQNPAWTKHLVAWINLHSQFGTFLQRIVFSVGASKENYLSQGPRGWWTDPKIAAAAPAAPAIRRARALFTAIDGECRRYGTKLCILVVGPVANYQAKGGASPLECILADWQLEIPVIDVAIEARSRPDWASMVFASDGHLTDAGHDYFARAAAPRLRLVLAGTPSDHERGAAAGSLGGK